MARRPFLHQAMWRLDNANRQNELFSLILAALVLSLHSYDTPSFSFGVYKPTIHST